MMPIAVGIAVGIRDDNCWIGSATGNDVEDDGGGGGAAATVTVI